MGRFTSVQAYADNNANLRKLTYEQATGKSSSAAGDGSGDATASTATVTGTSTVQTEKVVNPYGSTAGAGSGEFHVYRHARARELKRWKELDEDEKATKAKEEFDKQQYETQLILKQRTEKNRKKRQREKEAKQRKKHLHAAGIITTTTGRHDDSNEQALVQEEEFDYIPVAKQPRKDEDQEKSINEHKSGGGKSSAKLNTSESIDEHIDIPNDGSFLEMMKHKLQQEQQQQQQQQQQQSKDDTEQNTAISDKNAIHEDEDDNADEGPMLPPPFNNIGQAASNIQAITSTHDGIANKEGDTNKNNIKRAKIIETKIVDVEF